MKRVLAGSAAAAVLGAVSACTSSPPAPPHWQPGSSSTVAVASKVSDPLVLLTQLHSAGVNCTYFPTAYQYGTGYSQVQCIRGSASPAPKTPIDLVSLRVYDSPAAQRRDLAVLSAGKVAVLIGPNWTALPDADFPLRVLRAALGGTPCQ